MHIKHARSLYILILCMVGVVGTSMTMSLLSGCRPAQATPTASLVPTVQPQTPTPTQTTQPTPENRSLFRTYAYGELLPDMRVPIQRNAGNTWKRGASFL